MSHICMRCVIIIIRMCYVRMRSMTIYVVMWGMGIRIYMRNVVVTCRIIDVKAPLERIRAKLWSRISMTGAIQPRVSII